MGHSLRSAAAFMTAFVLAGAVPVSAESADVQEVQSVCPDFVPLSEDAITVISPADTPFSVKLVQHSPERADLVLYDSEFAAGKPTAYLFRAEAGDYTICIAVEAVKGGIQRVFQQDFTIENADFSTGEAAFSRTAMCYTAAVSAADSDDPANPECKKICDAVSETVRQIEYTVAFGQYAAVRGDYDGDGKITAADAQFTLNVYVAALAGILPEQRVTAAQTAACDIDADGALTAADAQRILNYYTVSLTGKTPANF